MNDSNDLGRLGEGSYVLDPEATVDTLLDDAGEWLSYAEGINEVLAEGAAELDLPDRRHVIRLVGANALLIRMAMQCVQHAKVRRMWDAQVSLLL